MPPHMITYIRRITSAKYVCAKCEKADDDVVNAIKDMKSDRNCCPDQINDLRMTIENMEKQVIECIRNISDQRPNDNIKAEYEQAKKKIEMLVRENSELKETIQTMRAEILIKRNEFELKLKENKMSFQSKEKELQQCRTFQKIADERNSTLNNELQALKTQLENMKTEMYKQKEDLMNVKIHLQGADGGRGGPEWRRAGKQNGQGTYRDAVLSSATTQTGSRNGHDGRGSQTRIEQSGEPRTANKEKERKEKVLLLGNSQTRLIDPSKFSSRVDLHKQLIYTIDDTDEWLKTNESERYMDADAIVIHQITNDVKTLPAKQVADNMLDLIDNLKYKFKQSKIVISLGVPRDDNINYQYKTDTVNEILWRELKRDPRATVIHHQNLQYRGYIIPELYTEDKCHLNRDGTSVLAANMRHAVDPRYNAKKNWR